MQYSLLIFTVLFVAFGDNLRKVECDDGLDFWTRDPMFEFKRLDDRFSRFRRRNKMATLKNSTTKYVKGKKITSDHTENVETTESIVSFRAKDKNSGVRSTRLTARPPHAPAGKHKNARQQDCNSEEFDIYNKELFLDKIFCNYKNVNSSSEVLGYTAGYEKIILIKLSENQDDMTFRAADKYVDEPQEKKIVFIVHGLSVMGANSLHSVFGTLIGDLLEFYVNHIDKFDIFLIPFANPDGYMIAANAQEYWNKNYSPQSACHGVNLDRNFDVAWNSSYVLSSCNQAYPGPGPFSEIETRVIRDTFHHYSQKIIAYFHVHAGQYTPVVKGDAVLYPRGFTDSTSDDDKYIDLKAEVEEAMRNASLRYSAVQFETLHNWYGQVFGSSVDYASSVYGIPYALELVMQIFDDENNASIALRQVWGRAIDVIFNHIHRATTEKDNAIIL